LLHVQSPLAWGAWWQYVNVLRLPDYAPYASKVKLAGVIGCGMWLASSSDRID